MISIISLVLVLTSTVSGLVPHNNFARHAIHARKQPPNPQYGNYLEEYGTYHDRYLCLKCQDKHNTPFFDECCHPLLATESVEENRPQKCQPPPGPCDKNADVKTPFDGQYNKQKQQKPEPKPAPEHKLEAAPPAKGNDKPHDDKPNKPDNGGGNEVITGGFATFYFQNGVPGACGDPHPDSDMICAMNVARYGNTGVHSSLCGKHIKITNTNNQKSVTVLVADACPGCKNSNSIDMSTGAFNQIAKPEEGMVPIEWAFV